MRNVEQPSRPNPLLKRQRELRGWSQGRVAEELHTLFPGIAVTGKEVGRWERGQRRTSTFYQEKLCVLFQTSADKLGFIPHDASLEQNSKEDEPAQKEKRPAVDWGEAPASVPLYGRDSELGTLCSWVCEKACRVLALVGMGGIGKTSLAVECLEKVSETFDALLWRSLVNAPPARQVIQDAIDCFSSQQHTTFPDDMQDLITLLIRTLQERRCLLVLDNYETILQAGKGTGVYREGYEDYGRLLKRVGETGHKSCLLLTSREKPPEVAMLEGEGAFTQSYQLAGLTPQFAQMILHEKGLHGEKFDQESLILCYGGNPLALKLVSQLIREVFYGDISAFLQDGDVIFRDIEDILDQQVSRLPPLERSLMYWLCIEREGTTLHHLHENLVHSVKRRALLEAVQSLQRRYLIEISPSGMTLQNVVMEYMTERLTTEVGSELQTGSLALCKSYALMQAQAKEYIRESQVHLIIQPIAKHLLATFGRVASETILNGILSQLRSVETQESSYAAGNILNLLIQLGCDLRGVDFSHLEIRQAYLQGVSLPEVNFASSRLLNCVFTETFGSILSVAFSSDGKLVAAGTANGEIRLWQTFDGTPLFHCVGHMGWVWSVAFNSDGTLLASGSEDETVRVWDATTGQCLYILQGHVNRVRSVAFSPDGTLLASGSEDQTIRIWDTRTGKCLSLLQQDRYCVRSVAFSPDGKMLVSGGDAPTLWLWDLEANECGKIFEGHTKRIWSVAFSPDGDVLASGGDDQTIRLWDVKNGRCLHILQGHAHRVWSVAFSSDGDVLASGGDDQTIRLWDVRTGQSVSVLQGHTNRIWSIAFNSRSSLLASGGDDQTIRLWDTKTGHCVKTLQGYVSWIWSIAVSPDGDMIATCDEDLTFRLRQVNFDMSPWTFYGHKKRIRSAAFSPDGKMVASSSEDQMIRLWDVKTGQCIKTFFESEYTHHLLPKNSSLSANRVWSVAFHPNGRVIASGNEDHMIRIWDVETGQCLRTLQGHGGWIWSIAFSPDGNMLASGGEDETVRLWDVNTGECLGVLSEYGNRIWSVAFSPDGNVVAGGGDGQTVLLWDTKTHQLLHTLRGHTYHVRSIAFSPDGRVLASGSEDETIRLWDMETYRCLHILQEHMDRILAVAFCASKSKILFSGSHDGTVRLWNTETGECLKTLSNERPYENMHIAAVEGLTEAQKECLRTLGAID